MILPRRLLPASSLSAGLAAALGLVAAAWPGPPAEAGAARGKARDIVVLRSERWVDTLQGAVKNIAATPAEDVVLEVRFRNARKTVLGRQAVRVGPLQPGEEREFRVPMPEAVRSATSWEITPRATFSAKAKKR